MSTSKPSFKRTKKKVVRASKTPPENFKPKWSMEEIEVDESKPYYGLSKEEFERIAFWRKAPRCQELDRAGDWLLANLDRIRAETIEPIDGSPMKHVPYDGEPS